MRKQLIMTLVGPDQVGIVQRVSRIVLEHGGNVEDSRMARLGGDFAMIVLASTSSAQMDEMDCSLQKLNGDGLQVFTRQTDESGTVSYSGWIPYSVSVTGADHEGIVNSVTDLLAEKNINVELMETDTTASPMSGTILFSMKAIIVVPPDLPYNEWYDHLDGIAEDLNLTLDVTLYKG